MQQIHLTQLNATTIRMDLQNVHCHIFQMENCVLYVSGKLFAESTIDAYPGLGVESVVDSSRYFVLRISDAGESYTTNSRNDLRHG